MGTDMVTDLLGVEVEFLNAKEKGCIRAVAPRKYGWSLLLELDNGVLKVYTIPPDSDLRVLP